MDFVAGIVALWGWKVSSRGDGQTADRNKGRVREGQGVGQWGGMGWAQEGRQDGER